MALSESARHALPDHAFALPGRRYPIHDADTARESLKEAAKHGTMQDHAMVLHHVKTLYPGIKIDGGVGL